MYKQTSTFPNRNLVLSASFLASVFLSLSDVEAHPASAVLEPHFRSADALVNTQEGENYIERCGAAGVPIPPSWGAPEWVNNGSLENEFTSKGYDAKVFYYASSKPKGICIALPRSSDEKIELLGIICQGSDTSNACFWDKRDVEFGETVPLETFFNAGGPSMVPNDRCTDCHAGENAFIIHPNTALDILKSLRKPKNWVRPLVTSSWAQNPGPTKALYDVELGQGQGSCFECHGTNRLPELTQKYCNDVLKPAMSNTMPPEDPSDKHYVDHKIQLDMLCPESKTELCAPANSRICANAGGTCEIAKSKKTGERHDLCRWPEKTASTCEDVPGIWTTKNSAFAKTWDTAVRVDHTGACVTQLRNLGGIRSTGTVCTDENTQICKNAGGFCEQSFNKRGERHDLCRWMYPTSASACDKTPGIWTLENSAFSNQWRTAVRDHETASCITQMKNIGGIRSTGTVCSVSNRLKCEARGGTCEQSFNKNGSRHDLCRWPNESWPESKSTCASVGGIWTSASSDFSQQWPTAVPGKLPGACITQMRNIGGSRQ